MMITSDQIEMLVDKRVQEVLFASRGPPYEKEKEGANASQAARAPLGHPGGNSSAGEKPAREFHRGKRGVRRPAPYCLDCAEVDHRRGDPARNYSCFQTT